jgi:hypothetical protein
MPPTILTCESFDDGPSAYSMCIKISLDCH